MPAGIALGWSHHGAQGIRPIWLRRMHILVNSIRQMLWQVKRCGGLFPE
jgi:hypothetical protein